MIVRCPNKNCSVRLGGWGGRGRGGGGGGMEGDRFMCCCTLIWSTHKHDKSYILPKCPFQ